MDQDKPILNLSLSEEDKDKIMNGATHIAITVQKQEGIAYGYVKEIGTEKECQNAIVPGFVVVPDEIEYVG